MKNFQEWLKGNGVEAPKGDIDGSWFAAHGLPMIVECSCCCMTMALPSARIDNNGNVYCVSCGSDE